MQQEESDNNTVFLDRKEINEILLKDNIYEKDGIVIKKWDNYSYINKYLVQTTKEKSKYLGFFNQEFEKDGYGIYFYPNNDIYFGNFKHDMRNYNGIYIWSPITEESKVFTESYFGLWDDNNKGEKGIYLWLEENEGKENFEETNFDAFVGEFENSVYKRGTFLQKNGASYHLFHGNYDKDGKKNDDDAFFYSASLDKIFHGKFEKDEFISGYIVSFNEDGKVNEINFCEYGKNLEIKNIKMEKDLNEEEKKEQGDKCNLFRNVILEKDFFGNIYNNYKNIINFIKNEMQELDTFLDKDKYPLLIKLVASYSINNIYSDIELKVFGRNIE